MTEKKESFLKKIYYKILDFILPRKCLLCGKVNPDGEYENVCEDCAKTINVLNGARCLICSEPVGDSNTPDVMGCKNCAEHKPNFNKSFAIASFDGAVREMVLELKYRTGTYIIEDMAKVALKARGIREFLKDAIIVPVPLHRSRMLSRKYNQSELLARMLAKTFPECNIKIKPMLKRIKKTKTQTTLDREERAKNMAKAFGPADKKTLARIPKNSRIIVIDDVNTTSVTLSECAKVLKKAGYNNVDAFSFARRI